MCTRVKLPPAPGPAAQVGGLPSPHWAGGGPRNLPESGSRGVLPARAHAVGSTQLCPGRSVLNCHSGATTGAQRTGRIQS